MMSKIEWCNITINPIVGCSKISEGCQNCFAEKMAYRLKCMGIPKYQDVVDKNGWTGKIGVDQTVLMDLPPKPKKIFVSSMGDFFHENVTIFDMDTVFKIVRLNPQHTFIFLTKRIERVLDLFHPTKYLPNFWLGVTAENQRRAYERIPILLQIPAAVRFVSVEPCLSEINLTPYLHCGIGWVIIGAESGPKKRYFNPKWAERIIQQCEKENTPVFYKQDGIQKMPKINGKIYAQFPDSTNKMSA
ncbi:MAG: DUF5131 family protein [Candidatus Moraniibacteriota bacterium]